VCEYGDVQIYAPPGWPPRVRPPGAPDWVATATAYLFDCCPPDFRSYAVLRRHPVVLARFAVQFVEGQFHAAQEGLASVRTSLGDQVPADVIRQAVDAWLEQEAMLARTRRAVLLVEEALRGRVFKQKL
jgi:hypothetical protein